MIRSYDLTACAGQMGAAEKKARTQRAGKDRASIVRGRPQSQAVEVIELIISRRNEERLRRVSRRHELRKSGSDYWKGLSAAIGRGGLTPVRRRPTRSAVWRARQDLNL